MEKVQEIKTLENSSAKEASQDLIKEQNGKDIKLVADVQMHISSFDRLKDEKAITQELEELHQEHVVKRKSRLLSNNNENGNLDIAQIGSTPQGRITSDLKRMSDVDC